MTRANLPMSSLLSTIESPKDVRRLTRAQLTPLADEMWMVAPGAMSPARASGASATRMLVA